MRITSFLKIFILTLLLVTSVNKASAHGWHVGVFFGGPAFYGRPVYPVYYAPPPVYYGPPVAYYDYGPPVRSYVRWVPSHYEYGYWVPGHYVRYYARSF